MKKSILFNTPQLSNEQFPREINQRSFHVWNEKAMKSEKISLGNHCESLTANTWNLSRNVLIIKRLHVSLTLLRNSYFIAFLWIWASINSPNKRVAWIITKIANTSKMFAKIMQISSYVVNVLQILSMYEIYEFMQSKVNKFVPRTDTECRWWNMLN